MRSDARPRDPKRSDQEDQATQSGDLLWGLHSVWEALQGNRQGVEEILIQQGKAGPRLQQIIEAARTAGVPVRFVEANRMGVERHCRHQGVVARQTAARLRSLDELVADCTGRQGEPPRLLMLDSIQDPRNLGSILRSALAAGFAHIVLSRERSASLTGTVAKTSAGAVAHLHLAQVANLAETLKQLKAQGFWIFGAVVEPGAASIYETDFSGPVCLVIGGEDKGIRPLVRRQCDHLVTIPMQGSFNSLNASVAAAIIMFEIARRSL
jgi:23S rRNA (guanosine2251-2'-O)-methyltransferase